MSELQQAMVLWRYWRARLDASRGEDGAITTEVAIITAILAALALTVGAIIVVKVTSKAEAIPME
jgi:hypothetical protein